ncbi:MAG: peptidyl-prolyl cis-trans isomerase [Candidatus Omnitrophica bacterium]|nr:peptidyl-prolyl cis-trans isomerase [Candidatus Omnitrophota bacterium]
MSGRYLIRGVGLLAALAVVAGCGQGGKISAVVNGQAITSGDLDQRMAKLSPSSRAALGNDRRRLLDELITETLLIQEARRRGLEQDIEVRQLIKEARRQILVGRLLEVVRTQMPVEVSDQEIKQFYEQHHEELAEPESFRASHILLETEEAAKKALERVKGGEAFAKVAQELSDDPSKAKGGDIGFFTKEEIIPEFIAACERLKPGEMSGVVKTPLGYHVILLTDHRDARKLPFDEVQDQIRRRLAAQRQQRQVEAFVQSLRSRAQVAVHEPGGRAPSPSPASSGPPDPSSPQQSKPGN